MDTMQRKRTGSLLYLLAAAAVCLLLFFSVKNVQAAQTGFQTIGGKTYYILENGKRYRGWLELNGKKYYFGKTDGVMFKGWQKNKSGKILRFFSNSDGHMKTGYLTNSKGQTRYFDEETGLMATGWKTDANGKKYYFNSKTGYMAKGWVKNSKGQKRYFSTKTGVMCTGWLKNSSGKARYFDKSTGIMCTGLANIGGYYYYFDTSSGYRYTGGFKTVGKNRYYFAAKTGKALTGLQTINGKTYIFNTKGVMYVSTTVMVSGRTYYVDASGVASLSSYTITGNNVSVYDEKNKRNYTLMKEFATHPGVADGTKTDLDLLAALCESEAGDQGLVGMEAVALCILNRTIKPDKEFPSQVRYVIYQGVNFAQYSVVTNGALLKRLNGQYENRTLAYQAARTAMSIFNNYVTNGTPRKLTGFKNDFNYMYFMMTSSFWNQPLNFDRVEYFTYKDHTFFVDWV